MLAWRRGDSQSSRLGLDLLGSLGLARPVETVRQPPPVERVDLRLQVLAMPLVCGEVARAATFQGLVLAGQRAESGSKFQESWISVFGHGGA